MGECGGENSDFWPAGENKTYIDKGRGPGFELKGEIESYCRPQLHANGIDTFLSAAEEATRARPPIAMLNKGIRENYDTSTKTLAQKAELLAESETSPEI